jgi:hypothetical protein
MQKDNDDIRRALRDMENYPMVEKLLRQSGN